jgi:hypothetical protein
MGKNDTVIFEMAQDDVETAMKAVLEALNTQGLPPPQAIFVLENAINYLSLKHGITVERIDFPETSSTLN